MGKGKYFRMGRLLGSVEYDRCCRFLRHTDNSICLKRLGKGDTADWFKDPTDLSVAERRISDFELLLRIAVHCRHDVGQTPALKHQLSASPANCLICIDALDSVHSAAHR